MSKRLEILKNSLVKKDNELERRFNTHFTSVSDVNGQPLNDKKNGRTTLSRWDRQSDAIRHQITEIEKTFNAIEREESKISAVEWWYKKMPRFITDLIDKGTLSQWRRNPRMMFVQGVEKARIIYDSETGIVSHKYTKLIPTKEQYAIFRDVYNNINKEQQKT